MRDYSRLEATTTTGGARTRAWASAELTPDRYNTVMIDAHFIYPEPRPAEKVSADALRQILEYANSALKRRFTGESNVMSSPGPDVARPRMAITSVASKGEDLKAYQLVLVAPVATRASRAAQRSPERATGPDRDGSRGVGQRQRRTDGCESSSRDGRAERSPHHSPIAKRVRPVLRSTSGPA